MAKTRVIRDWPPPPSSKPAADLILGFVRGWSVGYTIDAAAYYGLELAIRISKGELAIPAEKRLRSEITRVLKNLARGKVDSVTGALKKHTRRPLDLLFWQAEPDDLRKLVRSRRADKKNRRYGSFQHLRSITLNDRKYHVFAAGAGNMGAREFFYSLIRRTVEDGSVERFQFCKQCQKPFYRKSMKANFCGDQCRWYFNNHSEARARRYIAGRWYADSVGAGGNV